MKVLVTRSGKKLVVLETLHPAIRDNGQAPLHDKESAINTGRALLHDK
jgi:hypothetical protein